MLINRSGQDETLQWKKKKFGVVFEKIGKKYWRGDFPPCKTENCMFLTQATMEGIVCDRLKSWGAHSETTCTQVRFWCLVLSMCHFAHTWPSLILHCIYMFLPMGIVSSVGWWHTMFKLLSYCERWIKMHSRWILSSFSNRWRTRIVTPSQYIPTWLEDLQFRRRPCTGIYLFYYLYCCKKTSSF
jgi:hypothetical protein